MKIVLIAVSSTRRKIRRTRLGSRCAVSTERAKARRGPPDIRPTSLSDRNTREDVGQLRDRMRIVYVSYSHPAVAPGGDQVACELCDNALPGHLNAPHAASMTRLVRQRASRVAKPLYGPFEPVVSVRAPTFGRDSLCGTTHVDSRLHLCRHRVCGLSDDCRFSAG